MFKKRPPASSSPLDSAAITPSSDAIQLGLPRLPATTVLLAYASCPTIFRAYHGRHANGRQGRPSCGRLSERPEVSARPY